MPNREVYRVPMRPVAGSRFQPTGFPDVGPALFTRPVGEDGWQKCLLVESAQSMGNHLEATGWDGGHEQPVGTFEGMPYVRVVDENGDYVTSSRTEAHRLASAFVKDSTLDGDGMREVIRRRLDLKDDAPSSLREIAGAVFEMDPMALVHGVFFAETNKVWPGQPKISRALTAFVEANDVLPAVSGGVKRDDVRHSTKDTGGATEGYGSVPFHRTEYVAREVEASFVLDLDQLASYGLPEDATELLAAAARWEIRSLLDHGFRPRTGCDLEIDDPSTLDGLPSLDTLTEQLRSLIGQCEQDKSFGDDERPLTVIWDRRKSSKKGKGKDGEETP
ncbi:MAG: type I-G CRISPR-associated RAMP protein Csb1/Cas7g [Acidimicrobiales bacterium]